MIPDSVEVTPEAKSAKKGSPRHGYGLCHSPVSYALLSLGAISFLSPSNYAFTSIRPEDGKKSDCLLERTEKKG